MAALPRTRERRFPSSAPVARILPRSRDRARPGREVVHRHGPVRARQLGQAAAVAGEDRHAGGERLDDRERACVVRARGGEHEGRIGADQGKLIAGPVERITELGPGDYASFPTDVPHMYEAGQSAARALLLEHTPT